MTKITVLYKKHKLWKYKNSRANKLSKQKHITFVSIFFHPDYTVGFGISPNLAPKRSRTIPPIGNFTLP